MRKVLMLVSCGMLALIVAAVVFLLSDATRAAPSNKANATNVLSQSRPEYERSFDVDVRVNGRPLEEYYARGKSYVEAIEGAEYEIKITNPLPVRVAVALSVDGLNTIDARRTTAWNASKWVIQPYETITIEGWQMSSERARRFYFTSEPDSYASKLGQGSNLGVISAVFFRERRAIPIPIAPPPQPRPLYEERGIDRKSETPSSSARTQQGDKARERDAAPVTDDEYAATGIGRSVQNDVRWINMELESRPAGEVIIRYEYYASLVRLGIIPRQYPRIDPLQRRERSTGFEDRRFSPEP